MNVLVLVFLGLLISSSFAEKHWYTIWPEYTDDGTVVTVPIGQPSGNKQFNEMLYKDAEENTVYASHCKSIGDQGATFWWSALLDSDTIAKKYQHFDMLRLLVRHVAPSEKNNAITLVEDLTINVTKVIESTQTKPGQFRRTKRAMRFDGDAPRQLKFISAPSSANNKFDDRSYKYDDSAGEGVVIYILDSGLNLDSRAWGAPWWSGTTRGAPEFLYAESFSQKKQKDVDQTYGHGTCMADLAAGKDHGIAKRAHIVAAQVDDKLQFLRTFGYEHNIDALVKIIDHINDHHSKKPIVVSMSWHLAMDSDSGVVAPNHEIFQDRIHDLLDHLDFQGVSLVASAANDKKCSPFGAYPCAMGDPDNIHHIDDLMVVGSARIDDGSYAYGEDTRDDWVTIYGPGDDQKGGTPGDPGLVCATPSGDFVWSRDVLGASCATALTAGLAAYYRGLGLSKEETRAKIVEQQYQRNKDGPKMLWNGQA